MKTKTRINKLISWLAALVMLLSILSGFTVSAAATADTWDGTAATSAYTSGSGTKFDPYIIDTAEQLAKLAADVRGGNQYAGMYFKLNADLDLNNTEWTPIGERAYTSFNGYFDGNNKKITNLSVNASTSNIGLFAYIQGVGSVYNLSVSGKVASTSTYVGGIVGIFAGGKIENCSFSGTVTGSGSVGGITGRLSAVINECYFIGNVTATGTSNQAYAGGIAGNNPGSGEMYNCYSIATVISGNTKRAGGLLGAQNGFYGVTVNCFTIGTSTAVGSTGGGTQQQCYAYAEATAAVTGGELAYKLSQGYTSDSITVDGSMWGQTIGEDTYPNFTGLKVGKNGTAYYNLPPELTLTLTTSDVTIENLSESATLIVASYNGNRLVDIKTVPVSADGTTTIASTGLSLTNADTIKAFLWEDMSDLVPLCESKSV